MGWLDEMKYECRYECPEGHVSIYELPAGEITPGDTRGCLECEVSARYAGFKPLERILLRGRVAFDQNGRKGYRITDGKGNVRHISQARMNYLETGDIRPGYTREYAERLRTEGKSDLLETKTHGQLVKDRQETMAAKAKLAQLAKPADVEQNS